MKRIVTIQDLTCLGKCALTVALPVVSAMGVEASVIPTAVLSVHTAFPSFTFHDLTKVIPTVTENWKAQDFRFDAIYTGYLGSLEQMEQISHFIDQFKDGNTLVFLDPVLGDEGALYAGFDAPFAAAMAKLCGKADVIVPNLTEACLLLGKPYPQEAYDESYIKNLLQELCALGASKVALTGVSFDADRVGVMAYDSQTGQYMTYLNQKHPHRFHGTGDLFASVCVGALTRGASFSDALKLAVDFTLESIEASLKDPDRRWYSVNFEEVLGSLVAKTKALTP